MADDPYATPILIGTAGASRLARLPLGGGGGYDELFIQKLVFEHPETLPVAEIDRAYEGLIPVCTELSTQAGPLDVLYVTAKGRLVVVEAKLWRNPEARRKEQITGSGSLITRLYVSLAPFVCAQNWGQSALLKSTRTQRNKRGRAENRGQSAL